MVRARYLSILAATLSMLGVAATARAQDAVGQCRAGQTDRSEILAADSLLPRLGKTFGIDPDVLRGTGYVRCMKGRLMACIVGANLDCGQADVSRSSAGGEAFCHDNPGADVVPMVATGHDTIFAWHCDGARAVAGKPFVKVDGLGFIKQNWRPMR